MGFCLHFSTSSEFAVSVVLISSSVLRLMDIPLTTRKSLTQKE